MRRLPLLLLVTAVLGCSGSQSRRFAVTALEERDVDCVGFVQSDDIEQETLDAQAAAVRKEFKAARLLDPPQPVGHLLRINEVENHMSAWFDPYDRAQSPGLFPGTPTPYDEPSTVYRGDVHDDFVEGAFEIVVNTDAQDKADGREACGDRTHAYGLLALTDGDSIQGRVRWSDFIYTVTPESRCAAYIRCARDFVIEGVEED